MSMAKGSQYRRISNWKLVSSISTGPWLFYLFIDQFIYQIIQLLHQVEEKLIIVVPVMPASELAYIREVFLVYED